MKLAIMFKTMLLPIILIVWSSVPCWAVADPFSPADHAMASSQPIPSILPKPQGLRMSEYLLKSQPDSSVHQRHSLLTPRQIATEYMNWNKDSDESASKTRQTLLSPVESTTTAYPAYKIPTTTVAPHLTTPKKPLSNAIYSSSLDAMAMNKASQTSGSRNVFSRRRFSEPPFHLGSDSNKWTPVSTSPTEKTSRSRGGSQRSHDFSFEGGGGGLDPRLMNKKPVYTQTDTFRAKDGSTEPELQKFGYEEVTKRRSRPSSTSKPRSRYTKRNKQNRNRDSHYRNSENKASSEESYSNSHASRSDGPPGHIPHASPELRWPDGSPVNEKSKAKFLKNPESFLNKSPEKKSHDYNNYSFLGSPEHVNYYDNKDKHGDKYAHNVPSKIPYSFELDGPISREPPKYTYIIRGDRNSGNDHSGDAQYRDKSEDTTFQDSREDGPYRYKSNFATKSRENQKYRTTSTESPHHSYDENTNSNEKSIKSFEMKSYDGPIYRPKAPMKTNTYRFRLGTKSSDKPKLDENDMQKYDHIYRHKYDKSDSRQHDDIYTHKHDVSSNNEDKDEGVFYSPENIWSSEKTQARHDEPSKERPNRHRVRTSTEKYYFEPSPIESHEEYLSPKGRTDTSKEYHIIDEVGFSFDEGYVVEDHFPKGPKSPERDTESYKDTSKSPERPFRPSYRYESQEMYILEEPSKEKTPQKSRPRSKWNGTHKWSGEPSSRSKETTTQPKSSKDRSRGSNSQSRNPPKHSRESSKRSRTPASHRSKKRKTTMEIVDEYAVHHIAGPPYHDSIPVDIVKTLEKDGGPSYIPKTAIQKKEVDSYEVAVDKFLDGSDDDDDNLFHFEEHSYNDPSRREKSVTYYEPDTHSARQSNERSLETATPRPINTKTSSHFGDVIEEPPMKFRKRPSKSGRDRTRILDELVYKYDKKHQTPDDYHHQNHRYDPQTAIGSNEVFNSDKNVESPLVYFEESDPFRNRDTDEGIAHHNAQEPQLEPIIKGHFEGITRHEPFGHQDAIKSVSHNSNGFQHERLSPGGHMEGLPRQRHSAVYHHDPFHHEEHTKDIHLIQEPNPRQHGYNHRIKDDKDRVQILAHIDENTPPNFYKSSAKYPVHPHRESSIVKHSNFHSLPVDETSPPKPPPNYDFSREPSFQVSYERLRPEPIRKSRRRLPATPGPLRTRDRRVRPDRSYPPNRSNAPTPPSRGSRDRGHTRDRVSAIGSNRDRFSGKGPRDRNPGPRDRSLNNGPGDRRSRGRSRDDARVQSYAGRNPGPPSDQQWNLQDLVGLSFPTNIGQLFG